ncbi:OHCU decarboxylase [Halothiobacillus diazotrophicus]|uniref:2-oxo-4-hydroxy-4-carboxy-5-ureidoimidazoline decarboxylase n=1 Tax=Halothiobacillus diazotrophicus TaxID=1860122 RepID=A0A191ZE13_9GAMM|nr:2-oxo-4-hydroxy-4-carboxy-5-ureidoimidazoline decarboxylase [Halothiobacillus diazotrophicus]ANJ66111.1 OHCU decarboxylase [Halothiobacillus diazotrophicus]
MSLATVNELPELDALALFRTCCAAEPWAVGMTEGRPYADAVALHRQADALFARLSESDWLQAFAAHPKIGDMSSLQKKYAHTAALAGSEQAGAQQATADVLQRLKDGNDAYDRKFGFIFIVCATNKSAAKMLDLLEARLPNTRAQELVNAAVEQAKITHLRLDKHL